MIAQAQSWTVPTIYYAAPDFGVALMMALFVLGLPRLISLAPPKFRENLFFRWWCFGAFLAGCVLAGAFLADGLRKLATG